MATRLKKNLKERPIRQLAQAAVDVIPKWHSYDEVTKRGIIRNILGRLDLVGKSFLVNDSATKALANVSSVFSVLSSARNAHTLKPKTFLMVALSGSNIEAHLLRDLVAPKSRQQGWDKARELRARGIVLPNTREVQLYNRNPKFHLAVPRHTFDLALKFSRGQKSI